VEKWAAFFCPLFHNLPERKEKKYFANTQHFYTKFQNKLSQIIDTFRSGVEVGKDVWLGAGVGEASAGVAEPFDGATGLQAAASSVRATVRTSSFQRSEGIIVLSWDNCTQDLRSTCSKGEELSKPTCLCGQPTQCLHKIITVPLHPFAILPLSQTQLLIRRNNEISVCPLV